MKNNRTFLLKFFDVNCYSNGDYVLYLQCRSWSHNIESSKLTNTDILLLLLRLSLLKFWTRLLLRQSPNQISISTRMWYIQYSSHCALQTAVCGRYYASRWKKNKKWTTFKEKDLQKVQERASNIASKRNCVRNQHWYEYVSGNWTQATWLYCLFFHRGTI